MFAALILVALLLTSYVIAYCLVRAVLILEGVGESREEPDALGEDKAAALEEAMTYLRPAGSKSRRRTGDRGRGKQSE